MALKINWSQRADRKFDKIIAYLEKEWGEKVTKEFVKRTYEFLDLPGHFPEIGTVEHAKRQIRGCVLEKQIVIPAQAGIPCGLGSTLPAQGFPYLWRKVLS